MKTTKKFFPVNIANIPKVEKWLEEQVQNGLLFVDYKYLTFTFEKIQPDEKKYFMYISPLIDKKDVFLGEFYSLKRLYGKRKSKIKESITSLVHIVEIDLSKIDNDYKWVEISRNAYYQKYFLKMLIVALIIGIVSFVLISVQQLMIWLVFLSLFQILRYIVLIFILKNQKSRLLKESNQYK